MVDGGWPRRPAGERAGGRCRGAGRRRDVVGLRPRPHISKANAKLQAPRVAAARGLSPDAVLEMVDDHVDSSVLGMFGEPGVCVLGLNLALDEAAPVAPAG